MSWTVPGQQSETWKPLKKDLVRAQRAVDRARNWSMSNETVEKAETRKAEMEEKRRVTTAARQRLDTAEQTLDEVEQSIDRLNDSDLEVADLVRGLERESERLASRVSQRKEAERTAEKMLSMDDDLAEAIVQKKKEEIERLTSRWNGLERDLEARLEKAKREQDAFIQS
uniref:Uncharacterized protein n=1 Tax=Caenorhabditis japonica TaxID=281687 RepID=A0A8R1ERI7_CAEJA